MGQNNVITSVSSSWPPNVNVLCRTKRKEKKMLFKSLWKKKKKMCIGRESNPDLLLGRQQCWPLHHSRTSCWGLPSYNTYRCPTIGTFPLSCKIHHEFRFSLKMIFLPPTSEVIRAEPPSIKKLKRPYGYVNHIHHTCTSQMSMHFFHVRKACSGLP